MMKPGLRAVALSLTLAAAVACADREAEVEDVSTAGTATAATTDTVATATSADTALAAEAQEPIAVSLVDYEIKMPSTLPAGPTSFRISNDGSEEHTFVVSGNGVERSLEAPLKPLEVATLDVDLQPGTYQVMCTYDNHDDEHNMKTELTVTAQ